MIDFKCNGIETSTQPIQYTTSIAFYKGLMNPSAGYFRVKM